MKNPKTTIGKTLKQARLKRRLTAGELAKRCNLSRAQIYKCENSSFIMPKNLPAFAKTLGIPLTKLRNENGPDVRRHRSSGKTK